MMSLNGEAELGYDEDQLAAFAREGVIQATN
jgi:hypothetical protein